MSSFDLDLGERRLMRSLAALFLTLLFVHGLGMAVAQARAGRGNDDCPVASKDPDCQ
jgi:hypothetical protein